MNKTTQNIGEKLQKCFVCYWASKQESWNANTLERNPFLSYQKEVDIKFNRLHPIAKSITKEFDLILCINLFSVSFANDFVMRGRILI